MKLDLFHDHCLFIEFEMLKCEIAGYSDKRSTRRVQVRKQGMVTSCNGAPSPCGDNAVKQAKLKHWRGVWGKNGRKGAPNGVLHILAACRVLPGQRCFFAC
ncbi:MAG TPA: hypothetical protein VF928_10340 [Usitatibacteraceae bacterium]